MFHFATYKLFSQKQVGKSEQLLTKPDPDSDTDPSRFKQIDMSPFCSPLREYKWYHGDNNDVDSPRGHL